MQEISVALDCPSFNIYSSLAEIAVKVTTDEFTNQTDEFEFYSNKINSYDDLEFSFQSPISSDEFFSNQPIKQISPIFNTNHLLNLEHNSSTSSSSSSSSSSSYEDLESIPSETYCIWTPRSIKSSSEIKTKRFCLKDLINRSNSANYVFVPSSPLMISSSKSIKKKSNEKVALISSEKMKTKKVNGGSSSLMASSHEIHYLRNRELMQRDRWRSNLPYRKDLIRFF